MKGYKGFEPGLICRDKQYAENTVFKEDSAAPCVRGMHFCDNPFEVLRYYPIVDDDGNFNEFAEVEALDEPKTIDGKKFASTELKIGARFSFKEFVDACVNFALKKTKLDSGENTCIGSSGYGACIGSIGNNAVIMCAGNNSKVKAKKGSWITLAEWSAIDGEWIPVCVKTEEVDGERIKEDTLYQLKGGEFVACE